MITQFKGDAESILPNGFVSHDCELFITQRYFLAKSFIPMEIEFTVAETLETIRPKLNRFKTIEEAVEAVRLLCQLIIRKNWNLFHL